CHHLRGGRAGEVLVGDGIDVMAGAVKNLARGVREVLVKLDLHRAGSSGTNSSRARSAPYAAAACTPAAVTVGYSATICSTVISCARQSSRTLTGTRVPATTACPGISSGSVSIESNWSAVRPLVCPADRRASTVSHRRARRTPPVLELVPSGRHLSSCDPIKL